MTSTEQKSGTGAAYSAPVPAKGYKAAVAASFLGWTLDAFDYLLVAYALTAIAARVRQTRQGDRLLDHADAGVLGPIGAFIFGLLADR